ncbi:hypothetical protein SLPG_00033 [Salicola phage CGphi29]|uniref:hypothetical protein n=1 Tax=Salicola phage CGphi29 TaxID=754067 RepID=UPI0002C1236C|nr:hypothetical protein SLPG_00033 [Salicola phage CGphi29]AGH31827.1 hypothetical protein SLPG_00033 [Salicola phage CGphi29]
MTNILKQFDTVGASNQGAWLHLQLPDNGGPAYLDEAQKKPLRLKIKGPDSDEWTAFQRKAAKKNQDELEEDDNASVDADLFARMTLDTENIPDESGEGTRGKSYDELYQLYLDYKDIRIQALRFVLKRSNFTQPQQSG